MATEGSIGVGTGTVTNASQNGQNAGLRQGRTLLDSDKLLLLANRNGVLRRTVLWNLFFRHLVKISR